MQRDIHDIILMHLLDKGYVDTYSAAESVMVNMSESWMQHIIEFESQPINEDLTQLERDLIYLKKKKRMVQRRRIELEKAKAASVKYKQPNS